MLVIFTCGNEIRAMLFLEVFGDMHNNFDNMQRFDFHDEACIFHM